MADTIDNIAVLLVDDSKTMRVLIKKMLRDIGVNPEKMAEAFSGKEALAKFESDARFDLVLMDWTMPGMTGIECLQAIRAHDDATISKTPVVMVTAEGLKKNVIQAADSGANGYVVKPFTAQKLRETISHILGLQID